MNIGLKIALYEPDIPQNTASIIRTCSCLGVNLEIIEPCGFLLSDKRFKRVVMDYMEKDKINFYKSSKDFLLYRECSVTSAPDSVLNVLFSVSIVIFTSLLFHISHL